MYVDTITDVMLERYQRWYVFFHRLSSVYCPGAPQDFGDWLRAREEFEYIVDGANVAYNSQNFGKGMFSFKQVRGESHPSLLCSAVFAWSYFGVSARLPV